MRASSASPSSRRTSGNFSTGCREPCRATWYCPRCPLPPSSRMTARSPRKPAGRSARGLTGRWRILWCARAIRWKWWRWWSSMIARMSPRPTVRGTPPSPRLSGYQNHPVSIEEEAVRGGHRRALQARPCVAERQGELVTPVLSVAEYRRRIVGTSLCTSARRRPLVYMNQRLPASPIS